MSKCPFPHFPSISKIFKLPNLPVRTYSEYLPQNIMHDRRVVRGSTHAAMVIPAGTYPDNLFGASSPSKKGKNTKVPYPKYKSL